MQQKSSSPTDTAAQALAERLRQRIQAEGVLPGGFFGTEADLAREYGVSHGVAREAVTRLKSVGWLESRKRRGLIVRRPDPVRLLAESLPMLADSPRDLHELAQLRYVLEVGAIELAVAHATDAQIDALEQLARDFERVVREGGSDERENDLEFAFHSLILQMTGSRLVAGMQDVLARFFELALHGGPPHHPREQTVWQHHAMVAAIRDRDVERARAFVRAHFRNILDEHADAGRATS